MKTFTLFPGKYRRSSTWVARSALVIVAIAVTGCGTAAGHGGGTESGSGTSVPPSTQAPTGSPSPATPAGGSATPAGGSATPAGFQVLSMTFVSNQQGFAFGAVPCGSGGCAALLGTTNGGITWHPLTAPTTHTGGAYGTCPSRQPCVSQVRFATPLIGYAFDPTPFITTDGGLRWNQVPGPDVTSLEAAGGNVIRVASSGQGCSGQPYQVQSAPAGTTTWHTLAAPRILMICPPQLYRQGSSAVLAGYGNPAGGVRATAEIARSDDGGSTWASGPDQCGGKDGYASTVTVAPPDVLVLLCRHQMANPSGGFGNAWVRVSVNGGASFGPDRTVKAPSGIPAGYIPGYQVAAASASRLLVVVTGPHGSQALLSRDGGQSWAATLTPDGSGKVLLVGFEDPVTARIAQGDLVWTTYDGGLQWTASHFAA